MNMPRPHNCAEELQRETAIYLFIRIIFPDTAFDTRIPIQVQRELAVAFEPWVGCGPFTAEGFCEIHSNQ
ncbi:MAG: hypothetical protein CBE20_02725 [Gammaproteobacteria bacterium TMED260]|nr:hypothetical protein [Gammaproteobacteria bacterium]OUX33975.1 MAG: hypothetical protein CBE20_02725 [Gammaproteobacteria bacterium TMED260]